MHMTFSDHFSKQAAHYARYRPTYSPQFYRWILSNVTDRNLVWDCGTGNGQAAKDLASHFQQVYATDPSESQIKEAYRLPNIRYEVSPAERCVLKDSSVDLVTSAQAAHWFDHKKFNKEVKRVLKPGGTICLWTYKDPTSTDADVTAALKIVSQSLLGKYWPENAKDIFQRYREIPFPYEIIPTPNFEITTDLNRDELVGYISSWSATQKYIDENGPNALIAVADSLAKVWANPTERKQFSFKMFVLLGLNN